MPFTSGQFTTALKYALDNYNTKEPVDQINTNHALLKLLVDNKENTTFTGGTYREALYIDNDSNYQNYFGADQVDYNERDPAIWTTWYHYNSHDGFYFDEDRLAANGIILTDDREAVASGAEKWQLINLMKQSYNAMKNGIQAAMALEMLQDGTASSTACPGISSIIDPSPSTGTVGGLDSSVYTWWRNNANLTVSAANLIDEMEETWRACTLYGGEAPDRIIVGAAFLDTYRQQAAADITRQLTVSGKGGTDIDAGFTGLFFKGVPLVWDPDMEAVDTLLSTTTRTKSAYFINTKRLKLRPMQGHWMINRKPERPHDRYVHYFGQTCKYSLTSDRRSALAIISHS